MSKILYIFALALLVSCNKELKNEIHSDNGIVFISDGLVGCNNWIELINGDKLYPQNWTDFNLTAGDSVDLEYQIIDNITNCEGTNCLLSKAQVLNTQDYIS